MMDGTKRRGGRTAGTYPAQGLCLGIETSCDETAAAVVRGGREVLSNVIASQIETHRPYGGVVPEIASRSHTEHMRAVVAAALEEAGVSPEDIDGVAVTRGPGLVGALLVGLSFAKGFAFSRGLPWVGVNHIEGHIYANFLAFPELEPPAVCLTVSGGHTVLVLVEQFGRYRVLGATRDDAAGEALDKIARELGLPYPGGPEIDRLSQQGNPRAVRLPRAMMDGGYDFSFSGLKTAALLWLQEAYEALAPSERAALGEALTPHTLVGRHEAGEPVTLADFAASLLEAVVDVLVAKTFAAAEAFGVERVLLAGGVAANTRLRQRMQEEGETSGRDVYVPPLWLCTDNAAMIAAAGHFRLVAGERSPWDLNAEPSLRLTAG